jgi:hypothetical protein
MRRVRISNARRNPVFVSSRLDQAYRVEPFVKRQREPLPARFNEQPKTTVELLAELLERRSMDN